MIGPDKTRTLGSGPGGLVLSGHTDTVPFDDKRWQSDPFTLTERDDRWYGLGTCDMKGFFPLAIEAAKAFVGQDLKQPLIILATADEDWHNDSGGKRVMGERARRRGASNHRDLRTVGSPWLRSPS